MPDGVRINRYLAASGLGTRRAVEGFLRAGRVTLNGEPCTSPATLVTGADEVLLDGAPLGPGPTGAVAHRAGGEPLEIVHPGRLVPVLPLSNDRAGLELLLADPGLAERLADPRFPLVENWRGGVRVGLGAIRLGELAPGAWRPVTPKELQALRRGARLPPAAG